MAFDQHLAERIRDELGVTGDDLIARARRFVETPPPQ
jgi:hypothetical protein